MKLNSKEKQVVVWLAIFSPFLLLLTYTDIFRDLFTAGKLSHFLVLLVFIIVPTVFSGMFFLVALVELLGEVADKIDTRTDTRYEFNYRHDKFLTSVYKFRIWISRDDRVEK